MSEVRIVDGRSFADKAWTQVNSKYNSAEYDYMNLIDDLLCAMNTWMGKVENIETVFNQNACIDYAFRRAKDRMNFKIGG